jgi:sodium/bile acid cotransporter 7
VWKRISRQWFLPALVISLAIGFGLGDWVRPISEIAVVRSSITASVLFLMGLTLNADSIARSIRNPGPALLGIGVNTFLVPLVALPSLWLLPAELAGGLIVTTLVPSTLASAAVWTRKAGGDDATAMIVSVVTNLACFLVAPLGLWLILGQMTEISAREQIVSLAVWVVIPMIFGQTVRRLFFASWAAKQQVMLSSLAQCGILVMVCFGSVASADRMRASDSVMVQPGVHADFTGEMELASRTRMGPAMILWVTVLAVSVHLISFALAVVASKRLGHRRPIQIAVGLAGSQKTLMVGLQIALDCGVSVLPMIIYHVSQLMVDTVIVQRWAQGNAPADGDKMKTLAK